MLTSTAGEVSTAAARAAPIAKARTLDAVAAASARARHGGTLSFPAATRWAPRRKTVPNISHLLLAQRRAARDAIASLDRRGLARSQGAGPSLCYTSV